jgi:hypothetical protein
VTLVCGLTFDVGQFHKRCHGKSPPKKSGGCRSIRPETESDNADGRKEACSSLLLAAASFGRLDYRAAGQKVACHREKSCPTTNQPLQIDVSLYFAKG